MLKLQIVGPNGKSAQVLRNGQLVIAPLEQNLAEFNELGTVDAGVTFYKPRSGQQFIITNIFVFGDKQVSSNSNATVEVFESLSENSATVDKTLLKFEISQNQFQPYNNVNILVNPDVFINAKTDDDDIHMNILGYYIEKG